jgi:uncharacterized protein YbjT (DUF2867 family)
MTQKEFDYLVLGASGHVGFAVLNNLPAGTRRLAAVHNAEKLQLASYPEIERVVTDVADTDALRELFLITRRAFLLNPPADPSKDTNAEELKTARSIASALEGSGIEKVVVASTYGAQPGDGIGDLSVLFEFERLVEAAEIPTAINRGAYYFTNLDQLIDAARQGSIETPFPPSREMPMVGPNDLGRAAAERLVSDIDDIGVRYIEGPRRYSFIDVASAFADELGHAVTVAQMPRDEIEQSYRNVGFSPAAARTFTRMTEVSIDGVEMPAAPWKGEATLAEYIAERVSSRHS